jgi:hypothetical protein
LSLYREDQMARQAEAKAKAKAAAQALAKAKAAERERAKAQRQREQQKSIAMRELVKKAGVALTAKSSGGAAGSSRGGGGGGGGVLPGVHVLHGANHSLRAPPAAVSAGGGWAGKVEEQQRHELPGKENHMVRGTVCWALGGRAALPARTSVCSGR